MENRNGLAVNCYMTPADCHGEPQAAVAMVEEIPGQHRVTLGADKGYDRKGFVQELRDHQVTPHIARKQTSIIDDRTTRHPGYAVSHQKRKRVEEILAAQDRRRAAQDPSHRTPESRLDIHVGTCGLQSGEDAQSGDCIVCDLSASEGPKNGPVDPYRNHHTSEQMLAANRHALIRYSVRS
jgi:hypothetical protein